MNLRMHRALILDSGPLSKSRFLSALEGAGIERNNIFEAENLDEAVEILKKMEINL